MVTLVFCNDLKQAQHEETVKIKPLDTPKAGGLAVYP